MIKIIYKLTENGDYINARYFGSMVTLVEAVNDHISKLPEGSHAVPYTEPDIVKMIDMWVSVELLQGGYLIQGYSLKVSSHILNS
jgi:hypothetical protein